MDFANASRDSAAAIASMVLWRSLITPHLSQIATAEAIVERLQRPWSAVAQKPKAEGHAAEAPGRNCPPAATASSGPNSDAAVWAPRSPLAGGEPRPTRGETLERGGGLGQRQRSRGRPRSRGRGAEEPSREARPLAPAGGCRSGSPCRAGGARGQAPGRSRSPRRARPHRRRCPAAPASGPPSCPAARRSCRACRPTRAPPGRAGAPARGPWRSAPRGPWSRQSHRSSRCRGNSRRWGLRRPCPAARGRGRGDARTQRAGAPGRPPACRRAPRFR